MPLVYVNFAQAAEVIKIYSPYSAGHSGTPALRKVIETANANQNIYTFVVEFKPGGNQIIAVKSIDPDNSLAIIAPAYVDNIATGKLKESDYIPVHALGNACWAVVVNKPLKGQKEFVVGGVGIGNAAHLTGLAFGDKYKFDIRYVLFKSNYDALVNMAGNNGVEFVVDKYEGYEALRTRNSKMTMIAASCPARLAQAPNIKTIKELGIDAPYIFNIIVAHKNMDPTRRKAIGAILNDATKQVGADNIYRLSAMRPPVFDGITAQEFYTQSVQDVQRLQSKYKNKLTTN
jgi:tripartite-type tricarboxylate transporter receptor subunit TctC